MLHVLASLKGGRLLQRAVTLKFEDWSYLHVCAFLPLFYFVGLALARRRHA